MAARVISALVLAPAAIAALLYAPTWLFLALTAVVAAGCFYEFHRLATDHDCAFPPLAGFAGGAALLFSPLDQGLLAAILSAAAGLTLLLHRTGHLRNVLPGAGALTLGILYCFGAWRCGIALREIAPHWLLFALALNWIADACAYFGGRLTGRHKLAPNLSPGKTVEGSLWSIAGSLAFGWLFLGHFAPELRVGEVLALSLVVNLAGQLGDLAESALKRGAGRKDSGTWLPGHGGWLDRMDSSLFAMPVALVWLTRSW